MTEQLELHTVSNGASEVGFDARQGTAIFVTCSRENQWTKSRGIDSSRAEAHFEGMGQFVRENAYGPIAAKRLRLVLEEPIQVAFDYPESPPPKQVFVTDQQGVRAQREYGILKAPDSIDQLASSRRLCDKTCEVFGRQVVVGWNPQHPCIRP